MELTIYNNQSPTNYVNKKLTEAFTLIGTLRADTSVVDPDIEIVYFQNMAAYNYAYIPEFGRYYYITDWISTNNNFWIARMHVDVLMSFWNAGLSNSKCVAMRNTTKKQYNLVDDQMLFTADTIYSAYQFPNSPFNYSPSVDSKSYVITLAGAGD